MGRDGPVLIMPTAYEQLNFLNQQNQQILAPINNFLAQRNALALQQAEAARQRAQMIEMENLRQEHALAAQKANFDAQEKAGDRNAERIKAEDARKNFAAAGVRLNPELTDKEVLEMVPDYFGDPHKAEESSVEKASAVGGRLNTLLADMTKELSSDTPESRKKSLMAFAADPANNALITVEGKIPPAALNEVVNKGDVNGLVALINQAAKNAGWFTSDKQVHSQLMAGLYNARLAANAALQTSPQFQSKQVLAQSLMKELSGHTAGIQTAEGWTNFGNAISPPPPPPPTAAELRAQFEKQKQMTEEAARKQTAVQARLGQATVVPAQTGVLQQGIVPWLGRNVAEPLGQLAAPGGAAAFAPQMQAVANNPMWQDINAGLYQSMFGDPSQVVRQQTPHEQLARELFARGQYDPRLGVPESVLRQGF